MKLLGWGLAVPTTILRLLANTSKYKMYNFAIYTINYAIASMLRVVNLKLIFD